jgi:hypothetical protein
MLTGYVFKLPLQYILHYNYSPIYLQMQPDFWVASVIFTKSII